MTALRTFRGRGRSASLVLGSAALASLCLPLAGCSTKPDPAPLRSTQWQVSRIISDAARPGDLSDAQQGRTFLVLGLDNVVGAAGCVHFAGNVTWSDSDATVEFKDLRDSTRAGEQCGMEDEDTAQRMRTVLENHKLKVTRPGDNSLKLTQDRAGVQNWETPLSVEFISGPAH